jgi:copper(I)-binding protein
MFCDALKMRTMTRALLGVVLLAAAAAAQGQVEARGAWVRGTVQGQTTAGAYMEITSGQRASLLGAESPAAGTAEIHVMRMEGDVMRMRAVPRLELPPGKTVELKPGGYHMMLVDLKRPLKKGDLVPIRLKVELSDKSITTIQVLAEVRELAATSRP